MGYLETVNNRPVTDSLVVYTAPASQPDGQQASGGALEGPRKA